MFYNNTCIEKTASEKLSYDVVVHLTIKLDFAENPAWL